MHDQPLMETRGSRRREHPALTALATNALGSSPISGEAIVKQHRVVVEPKQAMEIAAVYAGEFGASVDGLGLK